MIEDITNSLQPEELEPPTRQGYFNTELEDLWSPKKIQPYIFPEQCGKYQIIVNAIHFKKSGTYNYVLFYRLLFCPS